MQIQFPTVAALLGDKGGIKTFFLLPWPAVSALPAAAKMLLAYGQPALEALLGLQASLTPANKKLGGIGMKK